jgi:MFS transporter, YNFM family, putative membrane transport protein
MMTVGLSGAFRRRVITTIGAISRAPVSAALVYRTMETVPPPAGREAAGASIGAAVARHLADLRLLAAFAAGFCTLFACIGTFTYVNFVLVAPDLGLSMMQLGLVYLVFLP